MTNRSEVIYVRVTPEEKELFEAHVDDPTTDDSSLAGLLRVGAKRIVETSDEDPSASIDTEELTNALEVAMGDVTERLERIEDGLAHIDSEVSIEEEVDDIAQDIAAELPVLDDPSEFPEMLALGKMAENASTLEFCKADSTADSWKDYVDEDTNKTRRALSRCVEWFPDVKYVYDEELEARRYYRTTDES